MPPASEPGPLPSRPLAGDPRARIVLVAVAVGILALAGHVVRTRLGVDWDAESIRGLVGDGGLWAPIAFVAIVALRMFLFVPGALVLTAAGALFGAAQGTLYGALGLSLTAAMAFVIVRAVGQETLQARVPPRFQPLLDLGRSRSGAAVLTVLSGYPIGPSVWAQAGAAVSGMALIPFALAVGLGSAVRAGTYSVFGNALMEGEGVWLGAALLAVAFALPLAHPRARAVVRAAVRPAAPVAGDAGPTPRGGPDPAA